MARIDIIGTGIDAVDMAGVLEELPRLVALGRPSQVITANVDQLVTLRRRPELGTIYLDAALVVADGMPLVWASRFLKTPLPERINGTDLLERACGLAAQQGLSVFLLGGQAGAAASAASNLLARFPGLNVAGTHEPYCGFENDDAENDRIVSLCQEKKPDILFTSLGFPKGVTWIDRHLAACRVPLAIEVGASFVFVAGRIRRAPRWMQRTGLEWAWRLMHEPRRLWRRYLVTNTLFVCLAGRQLLRGISGRGAE